MTYAAWMVIAAIIVTVFCGYKKIMNVTALAITFAVLIGYGVLGLSVKEILSNAPLSVMFDMFAVTFFFGYALDCGAFSVIVDHVLYGVRKHPAAVMPLIFLLSFLFSAIGPGIMAAGFMAPLAFDIAARAGYSPVVTYVAVVCGVIPGSNFIRSSGGAAVEGMLRAVLGDLPAQRIALEGFLWSFVLCTALFLLVFLLDRKRAGTSALCQDPPARLNPNQKKCTLVVLLVSCASILPPAAHFLLGVSAFSQMTNKLGIGAIMAVGVCAASGLRLGQDRKVLTRYVPWGTITMLGSMSILISIGKYTGMMEMLSGWISGTVPPLAVVPLLAAIAGIMSMFSSAIGVVIPTLFAIVPELAASTGLDVGVMYASIMVAATLTGSSPLSTVGGMTWGSSGNRWENLFYKILPVCFILLFLTIASSFILNISAF